MESLVVLIKPDGCPNELPSVGVYVVGETRTTHPFRTVRMWEMDPAPLLESRDTRVLPWAVLMMSTDAQVRKLAREVKATGDEELAGRLSILGGVRYDKDELDRIPGGPDVDLAEIIYRESSIVKWMVKRGHDQGRAEGEAEGRIDEARRLLRVGLAAQFPGLSLCQNSNRSGTPTGRLRNIWQNLAYDPSVPV